MKQLTSTDGPVVLSRVSGLCGELVLRRVGADFEIIGNGTFLMDTRNGESERLLVHAAAEAMPAGSPMVIGGLGVGFSLRAALDHPRIGEVVVVERESAVVEWNRGPLREVHGDALADDRVVCVGADLLDWLAERPRRAFGAICLDIDNGPEWTVSDGNSLLYGETGLNLIAGNLAPGGVLAVWSAAVNPAFEARLAARFGGASTIEIPVPRGEPDAVFLATHPRNP
ncbi:spermidine synthase [Solihabitans fulvus]|uniref:Spermidine synthase n=1 Tax=Solihabitans fulvus TaxID=1892852 RepID=A0A5B2XNW9_9PSEU|nr:spermidine synthase [Solihabitans fulvus]KAA2264601.1 spermidine synthase [Solihabitans fulvus]